MEFNFDNDENIETTKTPSVKAINNEIIDPNGKNIGAGLWIANENAGICRWKKNCLPTCSTSCHHHYKNTIPYITTNKMNEIPGKIILNPQMLILQCPLLLKVVAKTGRILRE
jgi:hypothetical protein